MTCNLHVLANILHLVWILLFEEACISAETEKENNLKVFWSMANLFLANINKKVFSF